ncbi:MAG: DNA mismatch repair protein MutS [Acidobacteriota bacterium]
MAEKKNVTPMMEQYFQIKKKYPDTLLFFRLGDFYELFYEDAKSASSVLDITLTSRQKVPMCGVPYHAADSYLAKLLRKGFKVAICEQVEDAGKAKGIVRREVVKILTPGTALEVDTAEIRENSYVVSVIFQENDWGAAFLDLASGIVKTSQNSGEEKRILSDELFKLNPREIIFPSEQEKRVLELLQKNETSGVTLTPLEDWIFEFSKAKNLLLDLFEVSLLSGFGLEGKDLAVCASGALLHYLKQLRKDSLSLVKSLSFIQSHDFMTLDATTVKNLELIRNLRDGSKKGSLLDIIDYTLTPMGARLLRSWLLQPLMDCQIINERLACVEDLSQKTIKRQELREYLKGIQDLERLTARITVGVAHPRDLVSLKNSLKKLPDIKQSLEAFNSKIIHDIRKNWDDAQDIVSLIEESINEEPSHLLTEGGIIKDGYNSELDDLRKLSHSGKQFISRMEQKERKRTGISSLKVRFNKVFGYYIEVTKPNLRLVPQDYIRKQTLINSERFITPELKDYEEKVLKAEERIAELEYQLFLKVRKKIGEQSSRLHQISNSLAVLDTLCSLAELAVLRGYSRPGVDNSDRIRIVEGRHPVIEVMNEEPFIPNDCSLDSKENQILIVTGPNMGGKSTYLRQVALISILAQAGSFVPAGEAELGVVDRIFTRIGAMDFLSVGQSTFMVEMLETANILNNATPKSLILLDEIGRGTSIFDGLSIAWAVAEHLHDKKEVRSKALFATHYHELTELSLTMERVKNLHVSVQEKKGEVVFLRKILPGPSDKSYGIHVAKLAGLPSQVIERAREILFNLEKKEFDSEGQPVLAYRKKIKKNRNQLLLFREDRERIFLEELKEEIEKCSLDSLSPLEALNLLHKLKEKIKSEEKKDV